jgi:hypothetical protein
VIDRSFEKDLADHLSVEFDCEMTGILLRHFGRLALKLVTRPGPPR